MSNMQDLEALCKQAETSNQHVDQLVTMLKNTHNFEDTDYGVLKRWNQHISRMQYLIIGGALESFPASYLIEVPSEREHEIEDILISIHDAEHSNRPVKHSIYGSAIATAVATAVSLVATTFGGHQFHYYFIPLVAGASVAGAFLGYVNGLQVKDRIIAVNQNSLNEGRISITQGDNLYDSWVIAAAARSDK